MFSTPTWIILILCSAYASTVPTTDLPTTRRYNLLKGHNKTRTVSKIVTPTRNVSVVLSYQTKLDKPLTGKHNLKKKPNNTTLPTHKNGIRFPNNKTKSQIERLDLKPNKNDTFGNHFYQIKLEKKNVKNKYQLKEDWSDYNISIPNPKPVISTYSPEYSIANAGEDDTVETVSVNPDNILTKFELDLNGNSSSEEFDSGCPNVHLSNSVLGPTTKQGCSDLSIAINTYLNNNQNPVPERLPINDLEAASAGTGGQVIPPPGLAASAPAAALDSVADPVGASVNGPGPLGGLPSLPELPTLPNLPNLKGVLDLLRLLGTGLGFLWGALSRLGPLLYIIPIISFLFGFTTVLPFYPWWLPLFFFTGKSKEPPKTEYVVHKHVHKPIHHHDGWFWNHNTKTWTNILDRARYRRNDDLHPFFKINWDIHRVEQTTESHSWKRRKK